MKELPIRIIKKRDIDDRAIEGGGSQKEPGFVIHGKKLTDLTNTISIALDSLSLNDDESDSANIPRHAKLKLHPKAIAKTHRHKIVDFIYGDKSKHQEIEVIEDNELLIPIDKVIRSRVQDKLKQPENYSHEISSIKKITKFDPLENDRLYDDDLTQKALKVKLFKYTTSSINTEIEQKFKTICEKHKLEFNKKTNYSKSMSVFKVKNLTITALDEIRAFEGVKSITDMPEIVIEETLPKVDSSTVEIMYPIEGKTYPNVGVLDSGVSEENDFLSPWLKKCTSNVLSSEKDTSHGTFVSGLISYPDILHGLDVIGNNGVYIHDFTVFRNGISEDELIDNIKDAIEDYHDTIKIWNLSLGLDSEVHDYHFSDFGTTLDELQDTYDVLIIKSAGNCKNYITNNAASKISKSADSVRSLVVGSISNITEPSSVNIPYSRSLFSRTGPGPNGLIKPDVTHFGGHIEKDGNNIVEHGVTSFDNFGNMKNSIGTSFSTPLVSSLASQISNELSNHDPLLLKSLIIHNSQYLHDYSISNPKDVLKEYGFGTPSSISNSINNSENEISMVIRDSLNKKNYIDILDFPYPQLLDDEGNYSGVITLTLLTDVKLDASQGKEYIQSDLEVKFGTYSCEKERDVSKRTVINPIGKDDPFNILLKSNFSKVPAKGLDEKSLTENYNKFHPVKKYIINLDELKNRKPKNKMKLSSSRKWFLSLSGLYRAAIESKYGDSINSLEQEYCLILTIRGPEGSGVYSDVTQQLDQKNFVNQPIVQRTKVRVN